MVRAITFFQVYSLRSWPLVQSRMGAGLVVAAQNESHGQHAGGP